MSGVISSSSTCFSSRSEAGHCWNLLFLLIGHIKSIPYILQPQQQPRLSPLLRISLAIHCNSNHPLTSTLIKSHTLPHYGCISTFPLLPKPTPHDCRNILCTLDDYGKVNDTSPPSRVVQRELLSTRSTHGRMNVNSPVLINRKRKSNLTISWMRILIWWNNTVICYAMTSLTIIQDYTYAQWLCVFASIWVRMNRIESLANKHKINTVQEKATDRSHATMDTWHAGHRHTETWSQCYEDRLLVVKSPDKEIILGADIVLKPCNKLGMQQLTYKCLFLYSGGQRTEKPMEADGRRPATSWSK